MEKRGGNYQKADFTGNDLLNLISDGNLQTEDGCVFHIHKYILAKYCKYFYALFCEMGKDKNYFLVPGIKGDVLSNILSYIYSSNILITNKNMSELMIAPDYLMIDGILTEFKTFMKNNLSIDNCIPFLVAGLIINREDFVGESYRFVQTNFERVVSNESSEIVDLPLKVLEQLLSDRSLCISSEMCAFTSIIKWVSFDSSERLAVVPNLIRYLMLSAIEEDSATEILQHDIVAKNKAFPDINNIKSSFSSSLEVIKYYIKSLSRPESLPVERIPPKLNGFLYHGDHTIKLYITYDEQIDLWRKISEIDCSTWDNLYGIFYIDDSIYIFATDRRRFRNQKYRYSLVDWQMRRMSPFITARSNYVVVHLEGKLYVLGGSSRGEREIYSVEIYNSDFDRWYFTTSMIPITSFRAAPLNNHIYVVGQRLNDEGSEMIAQVFDASTETWSLLPAVPIERRDAAVVAYLEKIYVIGGYTREVVRNAVVVEVFDPATNEWTIGTSLPYIYNCLKVKVFQDLLIVFEAGPRYNSSGNPPVFYVTEEERWECFEEPFRKFLKSYQFFTIDKEEYINICTRANRHPSIHFEKSPFA